jgi:hypothetical protein
MPAENSYKQPAKSGAEKIDVGNRQNRRVGVIFGWHANNHSFIHQSKETTPWIDGIFFKAQR